MILESRQIRLSRSLGQNFLHDKNVLGKIAGAAELTETDPVLEIGPGLGSLTEPLSRMAGRVLAVEKDRRLYEYLLERYSGNPKVELCHGDALELLKSGGLVPGPDWKTVSNLPYSVGSPILVELTGSPAGPKTIVATLQLEVAQRAQARPLDPAYGILSVLTQLDYLACSFFKISRHCFFPEPDVDSACLVLERRQSARLDPAQADLFRRVVKRAFGQRRKMMLKNLKADFPEPWLRAAWRELGLEEDARAEEVSPEEFAALAVCLARAEI